VNSKPERGGLLDGIGGPGHERLTRHWQKWLAEYSGARPSLRREDPWQGPVLRAANPVLVQLNFSRRTPAVAAPTSALNRVHLPLVGNALERVDSPVGERKPGAGNKILHGTRDEYLPGSGEA
jgi:hypothetical protein